MFKDLCFTKQEMSKAVGMGFSFLLTDDIVDLVKQLTYPDFTSHVVCTLRLNGEPVQGGLGGAVCITPAYTDRPFLYQWTLLRGQERHGDTVRRQKRQRT